MQIKIKKLNADAVMPKRATDGSAGFDLVAIKRETNNNSLTRFHTGLAFEIPEGYVGLIFPRSSVYKTNMMLSNCVGVIDSDYRGEVTFVFLHCNDLLDGEPYRVGDRVGQIIFMPIPAVELLEVEELSKTERGAGGYGSTGR